MASSMHLLLLISLFALPSLSAAQPTLLGRITERFGAFEIRPAESLAVLAVIVFIIVYIKGASQNDRISNAWFQVCNSVLQQQFAKVGAYQGAARDRVLVKDSAFAFRVYASGRRNCSGLLASIDLKKRQDLLSRVLAALGIVTAVDKCTLEVPFEADQVDQFVFMVCKKRDEKKFRKQLKDVEQFTSRSSLCQPLTDSSLVVLTEAPELVPELLDARVTKVLVENHDLFVSLHVSDRSPHPMTLSPASLRLEFLLPHVDSMDRIKRLFEMCAFLIDRVATTKLSSQARAKATTARAKLAQVQHRMSHEDRQELNQKRKNEALEAERESLSGEALQRFEARQLKLNMKRRGPKMKLVR